MTVHRRKRAGSSSPTSLDEGNRVEEGNWVGSDEDDDDSYDERDYDDIKSKYNIPSFYASRSFFNTVSGITLLIIIGFFMLIFLGRSKPLNFREIQLLDSGAAPKPRHVDVIMEEEEGLDVLPPMELDPEIAKHDAFGVAQGYLKTYSSSFMKQAQEMQSEFARLYGGIRPARHLLENTLKEFGGDAWVRLLQRKRKGSLHMVVLGDATAAGYGNFHKQAFSFGMEEMVKGIMKLFQIEFHVKNVAMEHVALFPYLWCMPQFVNSDKTIDLVYVDLGSMTAPTLEVVIRQLLGFSTPAPLIILRDSKQDKDRLELLRHYIDGGILQSPVLMDWNKAVEPFLKVKKSLRPEGFAKWEEWGASDSPQKGYYWSIGQHSTAAWVLSMFFLKHLELLVAEEEGYYELEEEPEPLLPSPILSTASTLKQPWSKYLFYTSASRNCLASFQPAGNLKAVAGASSQDLLIEHPKGMVFYTSGWVLDMENDERKEKLRSQHLGFSDVLVSYNGIPSSGTVKFRVSMTTSDFIICESQAPPKPDACQLENDVTITVDDELVKSVDRITAESVSYLGKHHCVFVELEDRTNGEVVIGFEVSNEKVTLSKGPCSVSHIIWQEEEGEFEGILPLSSKRL